MPFLVAIVEIQSGWLSAWGPCVALHIARSALYAASNMRIRLSKESGSCGAASILASRTACLVVASVSQLRSNLDTPAAERCGVRVSVVIS